jgi:hypothetical protein
MLQSPMGSFGGLPDPVIIAKDVTLCESSSSGEMSGLVACLGGPDRLKSTAKTPQSL